MYETIQIVTSIFVFFIGAAFASFLGLINYRVNKEFKVREILAGRSVCDNCQRELKWYEMIPVIGWMITLGRCKNCGHRIQLLYPVYELLLGFAFVLMYLTNQPVFLYPILCFLFIFTLSDMEFMAVPKIFIHLGLLYSIIIFLIRLVIDSQSGIQIDSSYFFVIVLALAILLFIVLINLIKKSFGLGDALIILMLSFVLNLDQMIRIIIITIIIGGVFAIMLVSQDKKWMKKYLPLVPFILLAFIFTLVAKL
jgi:leader peptidase (prepilin peptidase)/N-methyltransferase